MGTHGKGTPRPGWEERGWRGDRGRKKVGGGTGGQGEERGWREWGEERGWRGMGGGEGLEGMGGGEGLEGMGGGEELEGDRGSHDTCVTGIHTQYTTQHLFANGIFQDILKHPSSCS